MVAVLAGAPALSRADPFVFDDLDRAGIDRLAALAGDADELDVAAAPPAADLQALSRRIAALVERRPGTGAAVVVIGPSGTLVEGFGQASPERPMEATTLFRVGSLTKSFLSLAVMRLVEQGKLRLEDRVLALAPEIAANPWERTHPLRVAHLLEHTSGFDEMRFNEIFDADLDEDRPLREVLALNPRSRVARWPPGTRHSYSQPGYTTAAYLIEKVSGMPYERYLEEEVFRPLGIRGASLRLTPAARARLAAGHEDARRLPYLRLVHRPALNLMISAEDVSRLLRMLLGRGLIDGRRFLGEDSVERIERSGTLPYGPASIRYGLGNWGDVSMRVPMRGHGGFMPGYGNIYRYSAARGFGFAVMVNDTRRSPMGAINRQVMEHLLQGERPVPPSVPQPRAALRAHEGHYQLRSPNVEFQRFHSDVYLGIRIAERDARLWISWPERAPVPLLPTGPAEFRLAGQSDSSVIFTRTSEGRRAAIIGQHYYEEESALWAFARKGAMELALLLLMSTIFVPVLVAARGDRAEAALLWRPFLAALCLWGASSAFGHARRHALLGLCTFSTGLVWILSWGFGLVSYGALAYAARAPRAEGHLAVRIYSVLVSAAAVWVTLHLSVYGLMGLRTWRW
jgi:CubicO group peptidase (beta-lactamase class C family)